MKAIVCDQPNAMRLIDLEAPSQPQPDWVPVDISHVGICGTDFHIFEGKHPFLRYPRVIGHELSGHVAATGQQFSKGELVVVNPYIACGRCRACQRGRPNCCYAIEVLGVHRDGGMCERIWVPEHNLYSARGLEPFEAAMVEFLAIGAHAVRRSEIEAGDRVLVVGVGPIGLGVALFVRSLGAKVDLLDSAQHRLNLVADQFGFENTFSLEDGADALMTRTAGEGYDAVFDATGNARAMEAGFAYVAHGGVYVLVSVVNSPITFSDPEFHKREMKLVASRNATLIDFETVMTAIREKKIDTNAMRTHSMELPDVPERFRELLNNRDSVIKAVVAVS